MLRKFLNRLHRQIRSRLSKIADLYKIILDGYYYDDEKHSYIVFTRLKHNTVRQKFFIQDLFFKKYLLKKFCPADAYVIGLMFGLSRSKIIVSKNQLELIHQTYQHHTLPVPIFHIKSISMDNETNMVVLLNILTRQELVLDLNNICNNKFLIYGLDAMSAAQVGLLLSDRFARDVS